MAHFRQPNSATSKRRTRRFDVSTDFLSKLIAGTKLNMKIPDPHRLSAFQSRPWLLPALIFVSIPTAILFIGVTVLLLLWAFVRPGSTSPQPGVVQHEATASGASAGSTSTDPISSPPATGTSSQAKSSSGESAPVQVVSDESQAAYSATEKVAKRADDSRLTRVVRLPYAEGPLSRVIATAANYAYDAQHGTLVIQGAWKQHLGVVSIEEQPTVGEIQNIRFVELPGKPAAVAYQRLGDSGVIIGGYVEPTGIAVIDGQSLNITKDLPISSGTPRFLRSSNIPDAPYFYFTTAEPDSFMEVITDGRIGIHRSGSSRYTFRRIDLKRMRIDSSAETELSSSGVAVVGKQLVYCLLDFDSMCIDPRHRFVAVRDRLFTVDLQKEVMKLDFEVRGFLPHGPWAAGVTQQELVVGSTNDGRIVARIPFPDFIQQTNSKLRQMFQIHRVFSEVFFDEQRKYLVAGFLQHIMIIPFEVLGLPDEPDLQLVDTPPSRAEVGKVLEWTIKTVEGNATATLVEGPQGMTVDNGLLKWTPDAIYTSPIEVKVRVSAGNTSRVESWKLVVD